MSRQLHHAVHVLLGCIVGAMLLGCSTTGLAADPYAAADVADSGALARFDRQTLDRIDASIERARVWYLDQAHEEPFAFLLGHLLHRRFALDGMQTMGDDYMDATQAGSLAQWLFRRLISPEWSTTPELLAMVDTPLDRITAPALYCDRIPLPARYLDALQAHVELGGYELTHALLALLWLDDNGCVLPGGANVRERAVADSAALIERDGTVVDLEIEAAAFLVYAGVADRVPDTLLKRVLDAQLPDGGFSEGAGDVAHWHPTGLAMFLLLELTRDPLDAFVPQAVPVAATR